MDIDASSAPRRAPLRILLVSSLFAPETGGVCAVAEALASNLPQQITVVAAKTTGAHAPIPDWQDYDARFPFPVHRVDTFETELPRLIPSRLRGILQFAFNTLWTRRRTAAALYRFLTNNPCDLVCINTLGSYWVPAMLKRRYPKMKVVFYLHGEELGGLNPRRIDKLRNQALQAADAVIAVSSYTRDRALQCGVGSDKTHVIHNGVDTVRFTPGAKDPGIQDRYRLQGKTVLLCLARLDERKGQDMLLEAMPEILSAVPETMLLLVGTGSYEHRLRDLTTTLGLMNHVIFAGFAEDADVVSFYRTADVYVMPNRQLESGDTEGFGLVFLEAGACAKPVIGGRAGGVPDAIVEGQTGYLVESNSKAEIAAACIKLLTSPELASTLGRNGLAHSADNTWKRQAARFLALCESLCPPPEKLSQDLR